MKQFIHRLSLSVYTLVIFFSIVALTYIGYSYYKLPIEERFFHPYYALLKPSGILGHGLGIVGSFLIVFGLFSYSIRKRIKLFARVGVLKYWLEFHIFLCSLGTVMILFHTTFKFGGVVTIGFWSLVIVWLSGVVGRFIFLQIPRTIEGRELTRHELLDYKADLELELTNKYDIDLSEMKSNKFSEIKSMLRMKNISNHDYRKVKRLAWKQNTLGYRIENLDRMQNLFKYWHVAHLPFTLIMLIIMVVHIAVVLTFGYKWIF